jgi:multicomponent Na+:H+ antiporter subunit C
MIYLIILMAVYGLVTSDNLIKKIMCINIIESTVIFSFIKAGYSADGIAPVFSGYDKIYVNPLPQALMLTAIVVGVCFNCIALSIISGIYKKNGTISVRELRKKINEQF